MEQNDKITLRITGFFILLVFISLIIDEITFVKIKTDINGIHDSLKFIGEHSALYLVNTINSLILLILYIALSAAFFLGLKEYNNTLAHFITFGIAATGLTIMVTSSGSLSIINITREYILSSGIESEIIAINGLSIAELRKNSLLIALTFEGLSIFLFGIFILVTKIIHKLSGVSSIISGLLLVLFCWLYFKNTSFQIIRIGVILNYLALSILFLKKSYLKDQ